MKKTIVITLTCMLSLSLLNAQDIQPAHQDLAAFSFLRDFCISADGNEIFFTVQSPSQTLSRIAFIRKTKKGWSEPELMPFSGNHQDLEPFLSSDENRLYFASNRPHQDSVKVNFDIWYTERKGKNGKWSAPVNMGAPVNSERDEFYPSLADNGNLYITSVSPDGLGKDDIFVCRFSDGKYSPPQLLDSAVNSEGYEFNAFVSKDEKYLIFSKYNAEDGFGSGDLYISEKDKSGKWTKARNLGEKINSKHMEYCPFYDSKRKILYFTSRREFNAPQRIQHWHQFQKWLTEGENGLSKLYKTEFDITFVPKP